jgi:DNA-binding transcriptional LysR family regulator
MILECASAGMGHALVPRTVLDDFPHKGILRIHPLKVGLRLAVHLILREASVPSPAMKAFIKTLEATIKN